MSTKLIDYPDRIITDSGEVIAKHSLLMKKAYSRQVFTDLLAEYNNDLVLYNKREPDNQIRLWVDDGKLNGPDPSTYEWNIPDKWNDVDIKQLAMDNLSRLELLSDIYINRITWELEQIEIRGMLPFFRCLLYITDTFRKNDVIWGIGRGSSCACLVLFVLGVNRVDPVKYDINAEEFFK